MIYIHLKLRAGGFNALDFVESGLEQYLRKAGFEVPDFKKK